MTTLKDVLVDFATDVKALMADPSNTSDIDEVIQDLIKLYLGDK